MAVVAQVVAMFFLSVPVGMDMSSCNFTTIVDRGPSTQPLHDLRERMELFEALIDCPSSPLMTEREVALREKRWT